MNHKNNRKENWEKVKSEAPDAADFFTAINSAFGSPVYSDVIIDNELIVLRSSTDEAVRRGK